MNIVFYCQHVLGLGHFMRSLEIVKALAPDRVTLVLGGPPVPAPLPQNAREVRLPALEMDADFSRLSASGGGELEAIKDRRRRTLLSVLEAERPDIFFVELYPFGRKAFEFELLPALTAIREGRFGTVRVACGLRDILVEKTDRAAFEERVIRRLNAFFDLVVVHADPTLFPLSATFTRTADMAPPVRYSGYVAPPEEAASLDGAAVRARLGVPPGRRLIVASAGGGRVGGEVLAATCAALALPGADVLGPASLRVFSGPFAPDAEYAALEAAASSLPEARVVRFDPDFPSILRAADLSLSLAGYNTVMAVLRSGVRALVRPFEQNHEQRLRARRLEDSGLLAVLEAADLAPKRLLARMAAVLAAPPPPAARIALDGAAQCARLLRQWVSRHGAPPAAADDPLP